MSTSEDNKPPSLLKWIGIPVLLSIIFMGILYIAMETEPDYMPAQQKKAAGVDLHAKHANASSDATDHASHSNDEHAAAIAEEQAQAEHSSAATEHNTHSAH